MLPEAPGPATTRVVTVSVGLDGVAGAVVRVSHHLVCHVLLVGEELLQADDTGEQESDLGEQQSLADEEGKTLEGQTTNQTDLEDSRGEERAHVVLLATTLKREIMD